MAFPDRHMTDRESSVKAAIDPQVDSGDVAGPFTVEIDESVGLLARGGHAVQRCPVPCYTVCAKVGRGGHEHRCVGDSG